MNEITFLIVLFLYIISMMIYINAVYSTDNLVDYKEVSEIKYMYNEYKNIAVIYQIILIIILLTRCFFDIILLFWKNDFIVNLQTVLTIIPLSYTSFRFLVRMCDMKKNNIEFIIEKLEKERSK